MYKIYVLANSEGRIIDIASDAERNNFDGWTMINQGEEEEFAHPKENKVIGDIFDEQGRCVWELIENKIQEIQYDNVSFAELESRIIELQEQNNQLIKSMEELMTFLKEK